MSTTNIRNITNIRITTNMTTIIGIISIRILARL